MDTIYLNDFKASFRQYYPVQNIIIDKLHVLLYSYDNFLLDCVLFTNLALNFDSITTQTRESFNNISFEYNSNFVIFDMNLVLRHGFIQFVEYINHISSNTVLFNRKLYLIVKNIQILSKQQQNVLSNLIEKQVVYTFVCTTTCLTKINNKLQSRLFCKKEVILDIMPILKKYAKDQGITDTSLLKNIEKNNLDLYSSILHLHTGIYTNILENELNTIIVSIKKTKNISSYIAKVRDVIYKLLIYNISNKDIVSSILKLLEKKYKKSQNILIHSIHELSVLDHDLLYAAKPMYHFEFFFIKLFHIVNS